MKISRWLRRPVVSLGLLLGGGIPVSVLSQEVEPRVAAIREIFRPFQTEQAALAPDGKHLAFEKREGSRLLLSIVDLSAKRVMELPLLGDFAVPLSGMSEKVPARITYLEWPTADRLIACVNDELLVAVDADGRHFRRLLGAKEMRFETQWMNRPEFGPAAFNYDSSRPPQPGAQTDTGRPVLYRPDGSPMDQGFAVATTDNKNGNPLTTVDLFDSGDQAGPMASLRAHVLELLPADPEFVLVEIRGLIGPTDDAPNKGAARIHTTVVKVNIRTGKLKDSFDEFGTSRILCDRQGKPRGELRQVNTDRILRLAPKAGGRFVEYDRAFSGTLVRGLKVTPENLLGERTVVLGFDHDPDILFYATNMDRDNFAIHAVDLVKKHDTGFVLEHPSLDFVNPNEILPEDILVFDRYREHLVGVRYEGVRHETFWVDPELARMQTRLEQAAKGKNVEILEWDAARTKFLLRVSDQSDPGGFHLFDAEKNRVVEYAKCAPWLTPELANSSRPFEFTTPAGVKLSGYFTLPRKSRIEPLPLLVYCHDGPWSRDLPGYDRGAQALASMGFAVLQVNYRGSAGFGRAHLTALRAGDAVALDDIVAALDWIQARNPVSKKRVAVLGNGYGGYLALRAMQEFPQRFRCAVSINAPTDLPRWMQDSNVAFSFPGGVREAFFGSNRSALTAASPALNGRKFQGPVLIVQATDDQIVPEHHGREMRYAMARGSFESEYLEIPGEGHARWLPGSYIRVFDKLETFFNANIYNYQVEVGESSVVK